MFSFIGVETHKFWNIYNESCFYNTCKGQYQCKCESDDACEDNNACTVDKCTGQPGKPGLCLYTPAMLVKFLEIDVLYIFFLCFPVLNCIDYLLFFWFFFLHD